MTDGRYLTNAYVERHSNEYGLSGLCVYKDPVSRVEDRPIDILVIAVQQFFANRLSLTASSACGTLLGMARSGRFIDHEDNGNLPEVDMFVAWQEPDHTFSTHFGFGGSLDEPLTCDTGRLEGRSVTVAACSEHILELSYGPHWKIPDSDSQWSVPNSVQGRMDELRDVAIAPSEALVGFLA